MLKFLKYPITKISLGVALIFPFFLFFFITDCLSEDYQADAVKVGDEFCSACHDEISQKFEGNIHARLSVGGENT